MKRERKYERGSSSEEEGDPKGGPKCAYCGHDDEKALGKCLSKGCDKHFCNLRGTGPASHLVLHLVRSKHNEIETCSNNELGQIVVECYICGNRNVFILGAVEDSSNNVIVLCRNPCMTQEKVNGICWSQASWAPLIVEKAFVHWLFAGKGVPPPRELSNKLVVSIEEQWRKNPHLRVEDVLKKGKQRNLKRLKMVYNDGEDYLDLMEPMLDEESDNDKKKRESQTQTGLSIRFQHNSRRRVTALFQFCSREDFDASVLPGNELKLSYKSTNYDWEVRGVVARISNNDEVCLELQNCPPPPPISTGYRVQFVWKATSYNRMRKGLQKFVKDETSISSYLYYKVLGQHRETDKLPDIQLPKNLNAPGLPELNPYQLEAVHKALTNPLCLIQGPPGTGKTVTSSTIVYHLVRNPRRMTKVLVSAPSNIVVDMLAEKIHRTGVRVVRFCSKSRESVTSDVQFLGLHEQVRSLKIDKFKEMQALMDSEEKLSKEEEDRLERFKREAENYILDNAEVVCVTCIASADHRLKNHKFRYVLIDQATQAIEPECLLPLVKGAKHAILVGDHRQLGPVVISREANRAGLGLSLFERLVKLGHKPSRLQVQYRMHPELSRFPSNVFYEGSLQNGLGIGDRPINPDFPWPTHGVPLFFLNSSGTEEISASGTSYLNRAEASAIEHLLGALLSGKIQPSNVGIITPYKGQRSYLLNQLIKSNLLSRFKNFYKDIQITSVDGFQGREKDYIIISCVRSNESAGIGFLVEPRRMNVSITRARYGLILVGNAKVLAKNALWNNLLYYLKVNGLLFEGTCPNFKPSSMTFKAPERSPDEKEEEQAAQKDSQFDAQDYISFDYLEEGTSTPATHSRLQ